MMLGRSRVHIYLLMVSIFSIVIILFILTAQSCEAGDPPPPDDGINGLQYLDGDWIVNGSETYTFEEIVLTGNLTIHDGGSLTFNNVNLMMNNTNYDGEFGIEVQGGGTFNILLNSEITDSPFDVDNGSEVDYEFDFVVRENASFTMKNSELHECGWEPANNHMGLKIEANDVIIENNTIYDNYNGIYLSGSLNTKIAGNNIYRSGIALYLDTCDTLIADNTIYDLSNGMIFYYDENSIIMNNELYNVSMGIRLYDSSITLKDNVIYNSTCLAIPYSSRETIPKMSGNLVNGIDAQQLFYFDQHGIILEGLDIDCGYSEGYFGWLSLQGIFTLYNCSNIKILNNNLSNNLYSVYLEYSSNVNISNNIFQHSSVYVKLSHNNSINNNNLYNSSIIIAYSSFNNICGNSLIGISWQTGGISIQDSDHNNVRDNIVHSNYIRIHNSNYNDFINNEVSNSTKHGFYILSNSNYNDFIGNIVYNNSERGICILFSSSNYNYLYKNEIYNNLDGIYTSSSRGNKYIENMIYNNSNYGMHLMGTFEPEIINGTISNSGTCDINYRGLKATIINTTFESMIVESGEVTIKWYLHVHVLKNNGAPVDGARIQVRDNNSTVIFDNLTNTDGRIGWILVSERIQNPFSNTSYSPFNLTVTKGHVSNMSNVDINKSLIITIELSNNAPIQDGDIPSSYTLNEDSINPMLIDLYNYFSDDYDDDVNLTFNVTINSQLSLVNISIYEGRYLSADSETGVQNDNWSGNISVKISARDSWGAVTYSNLFNITILEVNDKPTAVIDYPENLDIFLTSDMIDFNASASFDVEGLLIYEWNFDDGNISTLMTPTHQFYSEGAYEIILKVTDDAGDWNLTSITIYILLDTDFDKIPNDEDLDDDNDGLDDLEEIEIGTNPLKVDSDGDGHNDSFDLFPIDSNEWLDTDSDGQGDNSDLDDDNDGLDDSEENIIGTNPLLKDTDGDGYDDSMDAFPLDINEWVDTDSDGQGDNSDLDDDNDGLDDSEENIIGTNPLLEDTDGDGYSDKDDDYPLNSKKWRTPSDDYFLLMVVIFIVVCSVIIIVLIYIFRIKQKRNGLPPNHR